MTRKAKRCYEMLININKSLDEVPTTNLSRIRSILNKIYFADIESEEQRINNKGNAYHIVKSYEKYYKDLNLAYTAIPKKLGLYYGNITTFKVADGQENEKAKKHPLTNYAVFVADWCCGNVIFSTELKKFVLIGKVKSDKEHSYTLLDEATFKLRYPVKKDGTIKDFLEVFESLAKNYVEIPHNYTLYPTTIGGIDWTYNVKKLELKRGSLKVNDLVNSYYPFKFEELTPDKANKYIDFINDKPECLHNMKLIFAYVMQRKMKLIPPEKIFLMKDKGRTGKGLFMHALKSIFKVVPVDSGSFLKSTGIEHQNTILNFLGAEVAHLNETGAISEKNWKDLRRIGTGEDLTGRRMGYDQITFRCESVLILDTNENIEVTELKANTQRMVNIAPKDRPNEETPLQARDAFRFWWNWITPNDEPNPRAGLSFLITSLDYLKKQGGFFNFATYTFSNIQDACEFTETQEIMLRTIKQQGFILAGDEALRNAIAKDYGNLRTKKAKNDIKNIGVKLSQPKRIKGAVFKVNVVKDKKLFNRMYELLNSNAC